MTRPQSFLSTVPRKSVIIFLAGVFLLFTTSGFTGDVASLGREAIPHYALSVLIIGVFAIFYAFYGFKLRTAAWKVYVPLIIAEVALLNWIGNAFPDVSQPVPMQAHDIATLTSRLNLDSVLISGSVALGYMCFVYVSVAEGRRYGRVHSEMRLAAEIHRVLVPPIETSIGSFEFCGHSLPSGEVGGDLVDVFAHNQNWIAYVADVSGHGVAPGVVMAMVKSAARMHLSSTQPDAALLERLNNVLYPIKKPEMFVTFAYLSCNGGELEYCTAGHPAILQFHAAANQISELECSNFPVGMFNHRQFSTSALTAHPGDLFLILTDGILEVPNKQDEEFGLPAVKKILIENSARPLTEIATALIKATDLHGRPQDDRSLLLVKYH